MYLKEFEGKALFEEYGIPVPRGYLYYGVGDAGFDYSDLEDFIGANEDIGEYVVKAQLLRGKRGKSGGILFATKEQLLDKVEELEEMEFEGEKVDEILVEEKMDIEKELYVSLAVNRFNRCPVLIVSLEGGMDIEEVAEKYPDKIFKMNLEDIDEISDDKVKNFVDDMGLGKDAGDQFGEIIRNLLNLFSEKDALTAEINPLAITGDGNVIAVDAKVIIDENAIQKHEEFMPLLERSLSVLEKKAHNFGLAYVELDGDIAIIGNGAGLVMATLDTLQQHGGRPANFCDLGGGANRDMMKEALDLVLQKSSVKGLLVNIFGGITRCDEVAGGILDFFNTTDKYFPMVVRIVGTNEDEARAMLKAKSIKAYSSFDEAIKEAANLKG